MSRINIIQTETLVAGGGTINITDDSGANLLILSGSATLTGSYTIASTGTFTEGIMITTFYKASMTFDGNNITILGKQIPDHLESIEFVAYSIYNGASWDTIFAIDATVAASIPGTALTANSIDGASILADTIGPTKMIDGASKGQLLKAGTAGVWEYFDAYGDGNIIIGQGADFLALSLSGHVTMTKAGVVTIEDNVITPSMLTFGIGGELRATEVTLTQAQVQALFSNPITILSDNSVGADKMADLIKVSISYLNPNTTAYAFLDDAEIQYSDGTSVLTIDEADLEVATSKYWTVPSTTKHDIIKGNGFQIKALTGNPTLGDASSTIKVRVYYTLMTY